MVVPEETKEHSPVVEVENLKTNDEVKFHMPWTSTLADVWTRAYEEFNEERAPADEFQCQDGTKLGDYLGLTLAELRDRGTCQNRKFAIRGPTGGA